MSELSNIPAHAVLALAGFSLQNLRRGADRYDQQVLECDFAGAATQKEVEGALTTTFGLKNTAGKPLEALYSRLTGIKGEGETPGLLVLLQNIPNDEKFPTASREALLDVFREVADFFYEKNMAFRVFYSIKKH